MLEKSDGNAYVHALPKNEFLEKFWDWAASWDCKEAEAGNHGSLLVGDEIGVGALWEDKSQKDFKSYLWGVRLFIAPTSIVQITIKPYTIKITQFKIILNIG